MVIWAGASTYSQEQPEAHSLDLQPTVSLVLQLSIPKEFHTEDRRSCLAWVCPSGCKASSRLHPMKKPNLSLPVKMKEKRKEEKEKRPRKDSSKLWVAT